ncbi:MAG: hypothetical protein COB67_01885 [SAR324 cluster bacterium]|uniref:DUF4412 domain-containing protein n=1 Tax=SAR324 cluster bacterium TaxID=2024889 RepID=A0A2A4TAN7_9DELT|nr:MAG: hypothetical protein COB67_01885 [SAR324 cluster bacterium]
MLQKRTLLLFFSLLYNFSNLHALSGFLDFKFGDNPGEIQSIGSKYCQFNQLNQDTRWFWKSTLNCTGFSFKGVNTNLYFEFFDDELVKVIILSKEIPNYFLIRQRDRALLIPMRPVTGKNQVRNLADDLIFRDQVHQMDTGQKLTQFFYKRSWEWEMIFEDSDYQEINQEKMEDQLDEEEEAGLKGWKEFKFDTPLAKIRKQLEGLCNRLQIEVSAEVIGRKNLRCYEFPFIGQKVTMLFSFTDDKMAQIKFLFPASYYQKLLPLLKRKYGIPYTELDQNELYYPYIKFPKVWVTLAHAPQKPQQVYLRYQKEGFRDTEEAKMIQAQQKPTKKIKTNEEVLLDNL